MGEKGPSAGLSAQPALFDFKSYTNSHIPRGWYAQKRGICRVPNLRGYRTEAGGTKVWLL
ncbi:unnamed protein product [marine sediment metagenome]|uniref:Uncharacterized protein n=1 Tax=marine sediment metagenome TaxID=412755 RepID=X1QHY5_9ZZZZ